MKIVVSKILNLSQDGASCHLLQIGENIKILLDCGLPRNFDIRAYHKHKQEIESAQLILISHSSLEYSGAIPLLVYEFGIDPKKIYTTQPIMRYSPLNFHESLLNLRHPNYQKKLFNDIYSVFEQINLVKPYQKKSIVVSCDSQVDSSNPSLLKTTNKTVRFSCYQAGGSLGNICWKLSMGLVSILYMTDFTNYSLNHISGLDLESIRNQPIDLLITDIYSPIQDQNLHKDKLYSDLRNLLVDFYQRNGLDPLRPKPMMNENDKKLLITCYPNEMIIEVMVTLKKVIIDLQETNFREKVAVIHLSSRFLQLIKSQVEHFSEEAKPTIDRIDDSFLHNKAMVTRINVSTLQQIHGTLNSVIAHNDSVEICHVGEYISEDSIRENIEQGQENVKNLKLLQNPQEAIVEENLNEGQNMNLGKQQMVKDQEEIVKEEMEESAQIEPILPEEEKLGLNHELQLPFGSSIKEEKENINPLISNEENLLVKEQKQTSLVGKYLSQIGFPHFVKSNREEEFDSNDYGLKHHLEASSRPVRKNITDILEADNELPELNLTSKKSTVEVMNIEFFLDSTLYRISFKSRVKHIPSSVSRTNFSSSLKVLEILKAKHVLMVNSLTDTSNERLLKQYRNILAQTVHSLASTPLNSYTCQVANELIEYKVNYQPLGQSSLQKVKGRIQTVKGVIHMHLQCLEEKEILQFRMEKFYRECKNTFGKRDCKFTGNGILICGIRICREGSFIHIQGQYSEAYFKVRKLLYSFLNIR